MKYKVLVVDDDALALEMLQAMLQAQGFEVILVSNSQAALTQAQQMVPDLVLLDVMMPALDGYAICRQMRRDPLLAEVPIILLTALGDKESYLKGMEAGADAFITKPFDPVLLKARLRAITRLNRYRGLLQERSKLQWIVEQTDEGYLSISDNQHIIYANSRAQAMLQLAENNATLESIPAPFLDIASQHYQLYPDSFWQQWPTPQATPQLDQSPGYLVKPASKEQAARWLQVELLEIPPRAGEQYFVRLRDVTQSVQENRLVWSFQDMISHKFRTPLALLEGLLDTISDDRLTEEQRQTMLAEAKKNTRRLQSDVDAVFRYLLAIDSLQPEGYFTLDQLLPALSEVQTYFGVADLEVVLVDKAQIAEMALPLPRYAIESIMRELMQNAVKFHPEQAPKICLKVEVQDTIVQLRFEDDGVGMPASQLNQIWQPYYQLDEGFSGEKPGMGLGLSMVNLMVLNVGGQCRAFNRKDGSGLVIEIRLPVVEE